jgi:ribosomal protein L25 (general stress protein Ctc)
MEQTIVKIEAQVREADKNPRQLRAAGVLPATVYGKGIESKSIQINAHEFNMAYKNAPEAVYEIAVGKETFKTTVQEAQIQYSNNQILNVEFKTV